MAKWYNYSEGNHRYASSLHGSPRHPLANLIVLQRIRYGSKTLDLNVKPETFRHEIYSTNKDSDNQGAFAALVSHEAHVKTVEQKDTKDAAGADAALAALKQSLASMAKEKEARK